MQEEQYRHHGSSNGFFGGEQFFKCDENCALFVPLDRLTPIEPMQQNEPDPQKHPMTTRSQTKAQQSNLDQYNRSCSPKQHHFQFQLNDRVVVHDKHGTGVYGAVKWIENVQYAGEYLTAVGIETVH